MIVGANVRLKGAFFVFKAFVPVALIDRLVFTHVVLPVGTSTMSNSVFKMAIVFFVIRQHMNAVSIKFFKVEVTLIAFLGSFVKLLT